MASKQELEEENFHRYGIRKCPICGSTHLVKEHGELYCKDCGYVIEEGYQ